MWCAIANVVSNNEVEPIVTELYIWRGKLYNTIVFIIQSYFLVRKNVRFNSTHYFIMKIPKRLLKQIAVNQSSDIELENLWRYTKNVSKTCFIIVNGTTFSSDNPLRFKKIIIKKHSKQSWQLMPKLKIKNCDIMLIKKQQKYPYYDQVKTKNMNTSQVKLIVTLILCQLEICDIFAVIGTRTFEISWDKI